MFENDKDRPRPPFMAGDSIHDRRDPLKRGRPGPARHFDERQVRQVVDTDEPLEE